MFQPDPRIKFLKVGRENVVSIIESINHPHVGVPGHSPQTTRAFIVGLRMADGNFAITIALFLEESRINVIYRSDQDRLSVEEYPEIESEALTFMESMGFMVDNTNFRGLEPAAQTTLLETLPCFQADLQAWATRVGFGPADPEAGAASGKAGGKAKSGAGEDADEPDDSVLDLSESAVIEGLLIDDDVPVSVPALEPDEVARIARLLASF